MYVMYVIPLCMQDSIQKKTCYEYECTGIVHVPTVLLLFHGSATLLVWLSHGALLTLVNVPSLAALQRHARDVYAGADRSTRARALQINQPMLHPSTTFAQAASAESTCSALRESGRQDDRALLQRFVLARGPRRRASRGVAALAVSPLGGCTYAAML